MALLAVGGYFRKMGVLPAAPDTITAALAAGRDVALWPGGEVDSLRPWVMRDQAILAGRVGFIRLAIRSGVPILLDSDPDSAHDDEYVEEKYDEVCASIQEGMDALARRRRLPLFG